MAEGPVAVVTGAGSGVGRATCVALARDGWCIVAAGRRPEPLQETVAAVAAAGSSGISVPTDVADPGSVAQLFSEVRDQYGRVDLLFNNAGVGAPPVPLEDLSVEDWQRVLDTNLTGSFLCAQQAFALMKQQDPGGGRIINNGSVSAYVPRPNSAPYTATKHAITGLTRSLSLDGREFAITCGQIDIGNALTELTQQMSKGMPQADGSLKVEATMDMADVARAVAYMASLPPDANVLNMTVMASTMPFVGRG